MVYLVDVINRCHVSILKVNRTDKRQLCVVGGRHVAPKTFGSIGKWVLGHIKGIHMSSIHRCVQAVVVVDVIDAGSNWLASFA